MAQDDLGTWLVRQGELTAERLEDVFQHQVIYGGALDTNILEMSLMAEDTLLNRLGQYLNLPTVAGSVLKTTDPDKVRLFPQKLAQKYGAAPFKVEGRNLSLALNAPPDLSTLDDIGFMLSVYIRPFAALEVRLAQALLRIYGVPPPARMENLLAQMGEDLDEDRAFVDRRRSTTLLTLDKPGSVPPPLPRPGARSPSKPPPLPTDLHRRPTPVRGVPLAVKASGSAPPISAELPTPVVNPTAREVWVAEERGRKDRIATPHSTLPPPLPQDALAPPDQDLMDAQAAVLAATDADINPTALSPLLSGAQQPPPLPAEAPTAALSEELPTPPPMLDVDPVFDDPESAARLQRRAERVAWRLVDARAEFAMATTRDDVVEVLLRFAYRALDYAAVFVLQGKQFNGWDSIGQGEVPRALSRVRITPAPGSALSLVEQTNSHYLGPLKPGDPLPASVGRSHPKVALLVPFSVKGRLVGVLYGERGPKTIPPRAVSDLQALTSDVGRTLEALILKQKRERLGFVDARSADASASIRDALREHPASPFITQPPPLPSPTNATTPPTPAALNLVYAEAVRAVERGEAPPVMVEPPHTPTVPVVVPPEALPQLAPVDSADVAAPPAVDAASPVVDAAPPVVDAAPPVADAAPPVADAAPPVADAAPPVADAAPPPVDAAPPVVDTAPPVVDSAPPATDAAPPVVDTAPPVVESAPPVVETAPPVEPVRAPLPPPREHRGATDVLLDAAPAEWGSWQPAAAPEPAAHATPPPLPLKRKETQQMFSAPAVAQAAAPMPEAPPLPVIPPPEAAPAMDVLAAAPPIPPPSPPPPPSSTAVLVEPSEANERHAAALLEQVQSTNSDGLHKLAHALFKTDPDPHTDALLEKAVGRSREAAAAQEVLAGHKGLALAAALRAFPGPLLINLFSEEGGTIQDVRDISPLCRLVLRLGENAAALAVAHGCNSARREARYLALLLARETRHAGVPALVAGRCFDNEPRLGFFASTTLDRMLSGRDERAAAAREAVGVLKQALEKGGPEDRAAAARAAENVHHPSLVNPLIGLVDERDSELSESVQRALQELTKQDFGDSSRKWRAWWKDNANRRRVDWLVDALGHKERDLRQSAQRELNQLTGEYLGYFHDAPKAERDAAITRWRTWVDANKTRLDLP